MFLVLSNSFRHHLSLVIQLIIQEQAPKNIPRKNDTTTTQKSPVALTKKSNGTTNTRRQGIANRSANPPRNLPITAMTFRSKAYGLKGLAEKKGLLVSIVSVSIRSQASAFGGL